MANTTQDLKSTNVRSYLKRQRRRWVRDATLTTVRTSVGALAKVAPDAAVDAAAYLFFKPQRIPVHVQAARVLREGNAIEVRSGARVLRGVSWGPRDAATVLLVHGWSGRAGQLAAFVRPLRAEGYRVAAFDLSGHGASDGSQATIVRLAEDLLAIGDHLGPLDGVVAHSFGGPVTTLALVAGLRAARVVFIAPPFDAGGWIGKFKRFMGFDADMGERLRRQLEREVGLSFEEISGAVLAPAMNRPLLVIHDEDDDDVPVEEGARLAAHWPRALFERTKGLGHQRILRDADVVASALRFITTEYGELS